MKISRNRNNGRVTNYWCVCQHSGRLLEITSPNQWMVSCKVYSFVDVRILAGSLVIKKKSYFGEITPIFVSNNVSECCHFDLEILEMISWIQVKEVSLEWFKDCFLKKSSHSFSEYGVKKNPESAQWFFGGVQKIRVHDMCSLMELSLICYEFAGQHVAVGQHLKALS